LKVHAMLVADLGQLFLAAKHLPQFSEGQSDAGGTIRRGVETYAEKPGLLQTIEILVDALPRDQF
jgi:hypothetical protein